MIFLKSQRLHPTLPASYLAPPWYLRCNHSTSGQRSFSDIPARWLYDKGPKIIFLDPIAGSFGKEVIIQGKFFGTKKGKVSLDKKSCKIVSWEMNPTTGENTIHFIVPKGLSPGTYGLKVTTAGVVSDTMDFTVE